eukprot:TRINITY_DN44730_c0_g1_i1.p1 TRINITY_DN44730_c0_g1~~TRINITY_DN44730_c0_g1_i1.p1  ORF type:complete len:250 (-),score=30.97 TRINITY_DN44730_c0_g1_i1:254-1003(-)
MRDGAENLAFYAAALYLAFQLIPSEWFWVAVVSVGLGAGGWCCWATFRPAGGVYYSSKQYWEYRYSKTHSQMYEWYGDFEQVQAAIMRAFPAPLFQLPLHLVELGAGTSALGPDMQVQMPHCHVTGIDFCPDVIQQMRVRHPSCAWKTMDALQLMWNDGELDGAVDKGTMDGMMKDATTAKAAVAELARVIRTNGIWVSVGITPRSDFERQLSSSLTDGFEICDVVTQVLHQAKEPHHINVYSKICRRL